MTHLIPLDGTTGALLTGQEVALTGVGPFFVGPGTGIFSGYDRIVVHPQDSTVYEIDLTAGSQGTVTVLAGFLATPAHAASNTWAYWGVSEHFGNADYITYVQNVTQISRTKVQDGTVSLVPGPAWSNLADIASITVSPSNNRWYFHHEGPSQFVGAANGAEVVGYADATFQTGDLIVTNLTDSDPGSLRDMVTQANTLLGVQTIGFQPGLNGTIDLVNPISVGEAVTIDGPGSNTITVAGTGSNGLFASAGVPVLTLDGLTLSKPAADGLAVTLPLVTVGDVVLTAGTGNVSFNNTLTVAAGSLSVVDGNGVDLPNTTVNGSLTTANGFTVPAGKTLDGTGAVTGAVSVAGTLAGSLAVTGNVTIQPTGTVAPGPGVATVTVNGNLTFVPGGTFTADVTGPGNNDRLTVNGAVDLGASGNALNLVLGYVPNTGDPYLLIDNNGTDPLVGTLSGVRNRSGLQYAGRYFQVRYDGTSGNDLELVTNSAPFLDTNVETRLAPIIEDTPPLSNTGTTVDALVATGGLYSDDEGAFRSGLAFVGHGAGGTWEFSRNGGSSWAALGTLSVTSARLLEADGAGQNRIRFNPSLDFYGTSDLSFKAWDTVDGKADGSVADASAAGLNDPYSSATETAAIQVLADNDAPAPVNDGYSVAEDGTLTVAAPGVLGNDIDVDGPFPLTAALVGGPAHGALTFNTDGSFVYTPAANYTGPDQFTYKAIDGHGAYGVAVVDLTVTSVNDNPTAVNDTVVLPEDGGPAPVNVLANDSSAPDAGETLTVQSVIQGANGTVTIAADNKSVIYTSNKDYNGTDSFTYTVADGNNGTATATVNITVTAVNDPPIAANDVTVPALVEDAGAQTILVLTNDTTGPDAGETLTISAVTQGLHGTVTIAADQKSVLYNPAPNFAGPDQFLYTISDGNGGTATAAVTVRVANDNADRLEVVTSTTTVTFTEKVPTPDNSVKVDDQVEIGTGLEGVLTGATVKFAAGFVAKKDTLGYPIVAGDPIKGKYDKAKGILTLTGTASPADYQTALRTVLYMNKSRAPVDGIRTIAIQVRDAAGVGDPGYRLLEVKGVNTPPRLTLPATLTPAKYKLGKPAVAVAGPLKIVDDDNTRLQGATVTISAGAQPGDGLTINKVGSGTVAKTKISFSFAGGVLTLTGNDTIANYLKVLKLVKFAAPTAGTRTLTFRVTDGEALDPLSNTVDRTVTAA